MLMDAEQNLHQHKMNEEMSQETGRNEAVAGNGEYNFWQRKKLFIGRKMLDDTVGAVDSELSGTAQVAYSLCLVAVVYSH
jgi:hypothetical protein